MLQGTHCLAYSKDEFADTPLCADITTGTKQGQHRVAWATTAKRKPLAWTYTKSCCPL